MKREMLNTRVTVKLRKSDFRNEWYLYLEAYPVRAKGSDKPQRRREFLNRTVTTPIWDKKRIARTSADGMVSYKPRRDVNGIILCKSEVDQESCLYADKVRAIRQREYDTLELYSETEAALAEQKEKSQCDFIAYFKKITRERCKNRSDSIIANWSRVHELMKIFTKGAPMIFADIDVKMMEHFKQFLLTAPQGGNKSGMISQNTASTYFSVFKAALKQAFIDGYLVIDLSAKVKGIQWKESRREHLTMDEKKEKAADAIKLDVNINE